jgi:hypothetical protein
MRKSTVLARFQSKSFAELVCAFQPDHDMFCCDLNKDVDLDILRAIDPDRLRRCELIFPDTRFGKTPGHDFMKRDLLFIVG